MKKLLFAVAILFASKMSMAQEVKFGVKAGLNLAKLEAKTEGISVNSESLVNFQVGGYADLNFQNFTIQPGLSVNGKGGKYSAEGEEQTINFMYLEIPVNAYYNFPVSFGKVYLGAGPYAAFALSGKTKYEGEIFEDMEEDIEFGSGDDEVKGTDFGLNFGGGVRLESGLNFGVNYGLGLSNLNNSSEGKMKNRVWGITVGYFF